MATKPWGVFEPGVPASMTALTNLAAAVGANPQYIQWYKHWAGVATSYTASEYTNVLNYGAIPILTWMPDDSTGVTHISNANILAGTYDSYIDSYANGIKALSGTVYIRLAHEVNGNWYDWSPGNNGNTAASFVSMWQYVWNRFHSAGVTNVKWVYCPYIHWGNNGDTCTYAGAYPGDAYVDIIGLDGYNKGDGGGNTWLTFSQVFSTSISDMVAAATTKPFAIFEMGCTEESGKNKAAWIEDALGIQIKNDSRIAFFVYFDSVGSGQYQLSSSTDATLGFASALVQTTSFGAVNM